MPKLKPKPIPVALIRQAYLRGGASLAVLLLIASQTEAAQARHHQPEVQTAPPVVSAPVPCSTANVPAAYTSYWPGQTSPTIPLYADTTGPHFGDNYTDPRGEIISIASGLSSIQDTCSTDPTTRLHYAPNKNFDSMGHYLPASDGFNLADVEAPTSISLPPGTKGLVYLQDAAKCMNASTTQFQSAVAPYLGNPLVYGFYLVDEPNPIRQTLLDGTTPCLTADLKSEADWIHQHDPGAQTFMVLQNMGTRDVPCFVPTSGTTCSGTWSGYNYATTSIDLYGDDPYPCRDDTGGGCAYSRINASVAAVQASGVALAAIVPIYQAFGRACASCNDASYILPTQFQETQILYTWALLTPTPAFDYAYSWGQNTGTDDLTLNARPELQSVFAEHNVALPPPSSSMPAGDLPGWQQIFTDDFLTDVPLGSFSGTLSASYPGSKWGSYNGSRDTDGYGTYSTVKDVSIAGGLMDVYLHTENGAHYVSAELPRLYPGQSAAKGQLYGRYAVRFTADPLPNYKTAWLLWPDSGSWPTDGEIDFPEGDLNGHICAFMHWQGGGGQDAYCTNSPYTGWHTAVTEWSAGDLKFILDGTTIGESKSRVPNTSMHYVLQTETSGVPADATAGHVQLDWVAVYKPGP